MLDFKKGTTAQDIINDGEYDREVKDFVVAELSSDDAELKRVLDEWQDDLAQMGEKEVLSQFDELDEEEAIRWVDVNEIVDYYENQGQLKEFVTNLNIDFTGLEESFGLR